MQRITILGSTGSIGRSTLDVLSRHSSRYQVFALTAHTGVEMLFAQCLQFSPRFAVLGNAESAAALSEKCRTAGLKTEILCGVDGLVAVSSHADCNVVMAAIVGAAGLQPTLAAAKKGKRILLANKEVLVMAGELFMAAVREHHATLLPVDSEHNAIFQSLPPDFSRGLAAVGVEKILLTASGGPFLKTPIDDLAKMTPDAACAHPNWKMGKKVSVDSATMMNKGLELIEARWLFDASPSELQVVVHPQSIVHSAVQYKDGSLIAQMGRSDMRVPIAHALSYPERIASGVSALDLFQLQGLDFYPPDFTRFPCLQLAYDALQAGGTAATILNAANEVAVAAFLEGRLPFTAIARINRAVLEKQPITSAAKWDAVLSADTKARADALQLISSLS